MLPHPLQQALFSSAAQIACPKILENFQGEDGLLSLVGLSDCHEEENAVWGTSYLCD